MATEKEQQQSQLKLLITLGKEQGYLTYAEVNDHLPDSITDTDQVEDIIQMINDMGINVYETAPDADTLLITGSESAADEIAAAEAAAALAAVETEQHRTTDPVRMYMREMGSVELLTREGEIEIAKRIEEGIREVMAAVAEWPNSVEKLLNEYDLVEAGERKLTDVIIGYLDPVDHVPSALEQSNAKAASDDDDNEEETPIKDEFIPITDDAIETTSDLLTVPNEEDTENPSYGRASIGSDVDGNSSKLSSSSISYLL